MGGYIENLYMVLNKICSRGLKMNQDKCVVMRITSRSSPVPYTGVSPYNMNVFLYSFSRVLQIWGLLWTVP